MSDYKSKYTGQEIDELLDKAGTAIQPEDNNIVNNNIYSEDEVRIGTWIDGKPIYRKVFKGTIKSTSDFRIDISSLNVEIVSNIYGYVFIDYNEGRGMYPLNVHWASTDMFMSFIAKNNTEILVRPTYDGLPGNEYCIVLEYTKTTD